MRGRELTHHKTLVRRAGSKLGRTLPINVVAQFDALLNNLQQECKLHLSAEALPGERICVWLSRVAGGMTNLHVAFQRLDVEAVKAFIRVG